MGRRTLIPVLLLTSLILPVSAGAANWDLVKNVKNLERGAHDYKGIRDIDKKFLNILDLTERTKKKSDLYGEAKRIAENNSLAKSKYMDSFLYYMLVKSLTLHKKGTAEIDYWLGKLKSYDKSHHLLAASLIRLRMLPKNSHEVRSDVQNIIAWLKTQRPKFLLHGPAYAGNILFGYKPRADFVTGERVPLFYHRYYTSSIQPLAGFMDDETYVSLLGRIKKGREDVMSEMIEIYKKKGRKNEASELMYELALLKASVNELKEAKQLLDTAVKYDPKNVKAAKKRDQVKLELTYMALAPSEETLPRKAREDHGIPARLEQEQGYLTPADRMITTADLLDRSKAELNIMRNEIYARHGKMFSSPDLQDYFSRKPWYREDPAYTDSMLSDIDRENIKIIREYENRLE